MSVSTSSLTVAEGSNATYEVVLDSKPTANVTVTPSVKTGGSADVTVSGALTFTPSNWSTAQTVTVSAATDLDAVADSATIGHAVSGADYGSVQADDVSVSVTEAQAPSTKVELSLDPSAVAEDASATTVTVTAGLDGGSRGEATRVTVKVGTGGTATSGTDYGAVSDFSITIAANTVEKTGTFTFTPTDDDVDEGDETVSVTGATTVQGLTVAGAELTIEEDDARGVSVSTSSLTVAEGSNATYEVVLDSKPTANVTVTPSVKTGGSADVTVSGALTFTPSNWSTAQTVTVSAATDLDAVADSATIGHAVSGADYGSVQADDVSVSVTEAQAPSTKVELSLDPSAVAEDASATTVTVTAGLDGGSRGEATRVTVKVGTGGTATSGTDYGAVSDFSITIAANTVEKTGTFTFTPTDDDVDEGDETVSVTGATTVQGLTVAGAELTIEEDDARGVSVSTSSLTVAEGSNATYEVVLDSKPTANVTVTPSVKTGGSADVTVSGALTFTPSNWSTAQTVTVSAATDLDAVADSATIGHAVSGADYGSVQADDVSVSVTEAQAPSTKVELSLDPSAVAEDASATTVTVTAGLDGGSRGEATRVTVKVGTGGTATSGTDYGAVSDFSITIAANTVEKTGTFTFTPTDDDVDEGDETVSVTGATTVQGLTVASAELTIEEDDARGVSVSTSSLTVAEGSNATYEVVLDSKPTANVTVTPSVKTGGSADVTVSGALTFTPSNWSTAQTVTVSAATDLDAVADSATIGHAVSGADYGSVQADDVSVSVTEAQAPSTKVELSLDPSAVAEDASATTVTVTAGLDGGSRGEATRVTVKVGTGGTATSGTDYGAVSDFSITIAANTVEKTGTFTFTPTDDDVDEGDETVSVTGATTVQGADGGQRRADDRRGRRARRERLDVEPDRGRGLERHL